MYPKIFYLFLAVAVFAGCDRVETMKTREDWLKATTREFPGKTPNDVLIAAEKVMLAADESDVRISHSQNAMVASRH